MGRKMRGPGRGKARRGVLLEEGVMLPADWESIEAALNEPELRAVWVSQMLYGELVRIDADEPPGGYLVLGATVPGRVMVLGYARDKSNMRFLGFDRAGCAYIQAVIDNPSQWSWSVLRPSAAGGTRRTGRGARSRSG
jgi:hypothetical protein